VLFLGIVAAYLVGSIPTAYIFARLFRGVDIRRYGSGNVGATNAFRVIGRAPAIIVLAIDIFKGYVTTTFIANSFLYITPAARPELYQVLCGVAAIAGHNWPVFLKFKGGKGVATSAGVVLGLIPKIFWLGFAIWAVALFLTGYVSVASILASAVIPIFTLVFGEPTEIVVSMSVLCVIIVYKHRSNLKRLRKGEEKKINFFKK